MSNSTPETFSPKLPGERVKLRFNFARLTSTPTVPVITITQIGGPADADLNAMKVGAASISGTRAQQVVGYGVDGADYLVACTVQTGTEIYTLQGVLPVRAR